MVRIPPSAARPVLAMTILSALSSACGGQAEAPADEPTTLEATSPTEDTTPPSAGAADHAPAAVAEPRVVRLGTGFTPDPWVLEGEVLGTIDAATLDDQCHGWLASAPDMIFDADTAFTQVSLLAHSEEGDLSLVVQRADGSFRCDSDSEGHDPMVSGSFAPGRHKVWIGVAREGARRHFHIGLTELPETTCASLETAALAP